MHRASFVSNEDLKDNQMFFVNLSGCHSEMEDGCFTNTNQYFHGEIDSSSYLMEVSK